MPNQKKGAQDVQKRLERAMREREAAKAAETSDNIVTQLTHESDGEPDLKEMARKLQERHAKEARSVNTNTIKDTLYIDEDIYTAFNALCLQRGDKKRYVNQALKDFVLKKTKELGI